MPGQPLADRSCSLVAMGMINALGSGAEEIWPRLLAGDQSGFAVREDLVPGHRLVVGEIAKPLASVPKRFERYASRNSEILLATLEQLEKPISDALANFDRDRIGVVIGTSTSGVCEAEAAIRHRHQTGELTHSFHYDQLEFGGTANFVADWVGVDGPTYAISTACSSGARALATARSLLTLGICDAVIAGASDSLCGLTASGFSSLQVVSAEITNPYSVNRSGMTLGEGAALFLCVRDSGGIQLAGVGESTEAHHMSAPDPDGRGAEQAMRGALLDAQLSGDAIRYVNLHGTGTQLNDSMEAAAVERTFSASPSSSSSPHCSSTKSLIGHTLGAAGAIEAGFCWLTLLHATADGMELIPHVFDGVPDPDIRTPPLVTPATRVLFGPTMTNSFGFGGNNCSLIFTGDVP
ncbi:MAG: beta-ketoacyl-ACP synthase [Myxococcota bacterium]